MRIATVEDRERIAIILAKLLLKGRAFEVESERFITLLVPSGPGATIVYDPQGGHKGEDDRKRNSSAQSNLHIG